MNANDLRSEIAALKLQREKLKARADGGKIISNGIFGKLGSPYSVLYAPHLMIAVTLTGQLSLLMLIEQCEMAGISVISGNTDGVVLHCPRRLIPAMQDIVQKWENDTGFKVEQTPYRSIFNRDVNTYIAIGEDTGHGCKVKRKGAIANPWSSVTRGGVSEHSLREQMMKNPQMTICSEAVLEFILNGTPLEQTVRACTDLRAFVTVIKVTGGALWREHALGRVVRYYWSTDGDPIMYANPGRAAERRVAKTEGARPLIELNGVLPADLDYARYVSEARRLAVDLAVIIDDSLLQ
jgi:hypothetical protein